MAGELPLELIVMRGTSNRLAATLCLAAVLSSCGGDMSLTEYVDSVNVAIADAERIVVIMDEAGVFAQDPTPENIAAGIRRGLEEVRIPLQEAIDEIDPPAEVEDLHQLLWTWHAEFIRIETALADRLAASPDTEEGWTQASDSEEMAAYRASLEEGKQVCIDFQSELDATEERGVFGDTPWLPSRLSEVVDIALGCQHFPEDPQSVYRYP